VAGAVEGGLEGEDDEHVGDALLHPAQAAALPGPELRADQVDDGDVEAFAVGGEAEVDVGKVDEDGDGGALAVDTPEGRDQFAVLGVDVGGVAEDLGDAHVGDVLGTDVAAQAGALHLLPAEAEEAGARQLGLQGVDELGAVMIAAGLAGGEEDAGIFSCNNGADGGIPPSPLRSPKVFRRREISPNKVWLFLDSQSTCKSPAT
jgi:hypothetical protein